MVLNSAFYPNLMWNGRFRSHSGDPFDNSQGFAFPPPEGRNAIQPPHDPSVTHLLAAQAHLPSTELVEMAGFTGTGGPFDDGYGHPVPAAGRERLYATSRFGRSCCASSTRRLPIAQAFGSLFPEVAHGASASTSR